MHEDESKKSSKVGKVKDGKVHVVFSRATVDTEGTVLQTYPVGEDITIPDQPEEIVEPTEVTVNVSQRAKSLQEDVILLDNQASISIFHNVDLLTNVRSAPQLCHVNGISATGNPILATEIGDYHGFTDIYACTDAAANILSFSQTKLYCDNNYDKERDIFSSQPPYDKVYEFKGDDGLYVYKVPIQGKALVSTVSSNLQEYSVREQTDAKKAKDLSKVLGYPSPQSIIDMINNGAIINCPVTAKDVARANKIYGPDLASLRGKSR
jgi:hypothetical protein